MKTARLHLLALVPLLVLAARTARADSLVSLPEPDYAAPWRLGQQVPLPDKVRSLVYPTIGAPSIVEPGGVVEAVVLLDDGGTTGDWRASITTSADPLPQIYSLRVTAVRYDAATTTYRLTLEVPPSLPEDTYDLAIESPGLPASPDVQPNAVRLWRPRSDYVFAHIADTQIRDPGTQFPVKFDQVLYELKLRDPAFTLFSGDINFGADYTREYVENWEIMRRRGLSLSCAPGNHDGYAWLIPQVGTLDYDGLYFWRKTFGPEYYSFAVGPLRIVAANSYQGRAARRNGLTFLVVNAGGHVDAPQLAWIEEQAREASAAGEEMLVHLHHNPSKPITPHVDAYPWNVNNVGAAAGTWNDPVSKAELARIAADWPAFSWFFAGHTNNDEHVMVSTQGAAGAKVVHYVNTTSPCNGGSPHEGYRLVTVRNGRIAEVGQPGTNGSVPFPLGANLFADFVDPNDGTRPRVLCNAENRLPDAVGMTLEFALKNDSRGFRTSAGTIRDVAIAASGAAIVYVRVNVPGSSVLPVVVEPDPSGHGARPGSVSRPAVRLRSGGGGGGGCSASGGPAGAGIWPAVLVALLAAARQVRPARNARGRG